MENKLEQLLNSLIEKGWKPFGKVNRGYVSIDRTIHTKSPFFDFENHNMSVSTRELIAKESGLWQFVCENGKYGYTIPECWIKNPKICNEGIESVEKECNQNSYEYYIIESALCDEDKLEEFLLNSIKLD